MAGALRTPILLRLPMPVLLSEVMLGMIAVQASYNSATPSTGYGFSVDIGGPLTRCSSPEVRHRELHLVDNVIATKVG